MFLQIFSEKTKKRTSKNSNFFEEGYDDRTLLKISDHRKSEKKFLEGFVRQVVFLPKNGKLDLVRNNTIEKKQSEKGTKQKNDRTNKVLQREMTNSKLSDFSTKNEK